ncbi:HEAT repeat domain-containing protein [Ruegeria lacuscaerulensis]|uniref:HEAT repeat domain-containing protein n=1 Tax=Ruegeria lacuscaerulensis TaxID=55218 RepID=UPI00147F745D|nr:multiheme c-type cytochrome [Ruegeria lacuscaerulensis]
MRLLISALLTLTGPAVPAIAQSADYVGSDACTECHRAEAAAWKGSHHAGAWTEAVHDNIRADFNGTTFTLGDMTARFRIEADGTHHVTVTERDGVTTDYPVHSVVGVEPLQQYLLETEPGRLQSFDVVWDTEKSEWFHLYPDQNVPPSDALHWTGPYKSWNARCGVCHATGYDTGYDPASDTYQTTQAEIGVGCEACHGPGRDHVGWAQGAGEPPLNFGFSADLSTPQGLIQQCAGCHSRREAFFDGNPEPGTAYHDAYNLSLLRPGLYYPDGQIRDEVYVYGSFLQSKMHGKGVTCSDCHDAHSAEVIADGNAVCAQCHNPDGNPRFPSLPPAEFDSPAHHHHPEDSAGAQCRSCHMTEQVYMGNDWRADHSFRIPRPDLSAETGAPDACTSCHTDQTPDWAAARLRDWFPDSSNRGPHFGQVLARAQINPTLASDDLVDLALSASSPALIRATAIWLIGQTGDPKQIGRISDMVNAADPVIRSAAVEAMHSLPGHERVQRVLPMLDDPSRNVRTAAARGLYNAPIAHLPDKIAAAFRSAIGEWQNAMAARLDFPETHLQLGGFALTTRNLPAADQAFARAVEMDPMLVDAWIMRIRIAAVSGQQEKVEELIAAASRANPGDFALESLIAQLTGTEMNLLPPPAEPDE